MPTKKNRPALPKALKNILKDAPKADPKKKSKKAPDSVYSARG